MNLSDYIGLPYEQYDCWELIRFIYEDGLDIDLPDYRKRYTSSNDVKQTGPVVAQGIEDGCWEKVDKPAFGDVLIFNVLGIPSHCAMYLADGDFIHAFNGTNSVIENVNDLCWAKRFVGAYKWKAA